jgi:hypothetical protein
MACKAATPEQARVLVEQLQATNQWWSRFPVPTVALDDPKFDPQGFWRGDMWPVTTYLVAYGLNRYGYHDLARRLTDRVVELTLKHGVNERYNPITGRPIGVTGLGMSCSIWSMIVENYYGVGDDFRTVRIPRQAEGRRLRLGSLEVYYPEDDVVELRCRFARQFQVVFPRTGDRLTLRCDGANIKPDEFVVAGAQVRFTAQAGKTYQVGFVQ